MWETTSAGLTHGRTLLVVDMVLFGVKEGIAGLSFLQKTFSTCNSRYKHQLWTSTSLKIEFE